MKQLSIMLEWHAFSVLALQDACGVGFVGELNRQPTRQCVTDALEMMIRSAVSELKQLSYCRPTCAPRLAASARNVCKLVKTSCASVAS